MAKAKKKAKKKKVKRKPKDSDWSYKDWYEANKAGLSARRKERYDNDPEYKAKVLEQSRNHRENKRIEEAKNPKPKPKVRVPRHRKPVTVIILLNGVPTPKHLVHIGAFSRAIGKSISTVHQWERSGLLPKTPLCLNGKTKKERLFTAEMISVVKTEIEKRNGRVSVKDPTFCDDVITGWSESGINLDTTKILEGVTDG